MLKDDEFVCIVRVEGDIFITSGEEDEVIENLYQKYADKLYVEHLGAISFEDFKDSFGFYMRIFLESDMVMIWSDDIDSMLSILSGLGYC